MTGKEYYKRMMQRHPDADTVTPGQLNEIIDGLWTNLSEEDKDYWSSIGAMFREATG